MNGPKEAYQPDGRATRVCVSPLKWAEYSGKECVSDATARLKMLAEVYTLEIASEVCSFQNTVEFL